MASQSHFLEFNAKMAQKNKSRSNFFVQKCLEMHENEHVVLNESLEVLGNLLGNRSDFGTCHDNS